MKTTKYTINDFNKRFPDDNACLEEIFNIKYGNPSFCQNCTHRAKFYRVTNKKCYACGECGYQISPTAGTIFEKSSTSLRDWFYAIFLFSTSKNGVSAKELQRQLGVTYKCAWRIANQIRKLFSDDTDPLSGIVEADETYVGGKGKGIKTRGRNTDNKTPVIGLVERQGRVKAQVTADTKSSTVIPFIKANVIQGSNLMTDEYRSYNNATKEGYKHETINHSRKQYVSGNIHVNTIEGFWSQVKRSIDGTYHAVSPKYLQNYVDEFAYRYNNRNNVIPLFSALIDRVTQP